MLCRQVDPPAAKATGESGRSAPPAAATAPAQPPGIRRFWNPLGIPRHWAFLHLYAAPPAPCHYHEPNALLPGTVRPKCFICVRSWPDHPLAGPAVRAASRCLPTAVRIWCRTSRPTSRRQAGSRSGRPASPARRQIRCLSQSGAPLPKASLRASTSNVKRQTARSSWCMHHGLVNKQPACCMVRKKFGQMVGLSARCAG